MAEDHNAEDIFGSDPAKDDLGNAHSLLPGAFQGGQLFIPNRGVLIVLPGDWVGVDSQGWPILVSKNSISSGPWTHS